MRAMDTPHATALPPPELATEWAAGSADTTAPPPPPMTPVNSTQRIEALDVVRGFALIGIFMMNIEDRTSVV